MVSEPNPGHNQILGSTMVDSIIQLKKLAQTGSIKDYYEEFDSIQRSVDLLEYFLISWFIAGLKADTRREVQSIRPQTVIQAYAYGRLYELAYPKGRPLQSVSTSLASIPIPESQEDQASIVSNQGGKIQSNLGTLGIHSTPASQEDDDYDLQLELQKSNQNICEGLQELDRSKMLTSIDTNMDATNLIEREEEKSEREFAHHVFDESPRYDMMKSDDVRYDGLLGNDDVVIIDQDLVQIETKFEQILMIEPSDMNAFHVLDERPMPISSQETHLVEEQDDPKAFELMNGLTSQDDMAMDYMRVQCFDPGGDLHNSAAGVDNICSDLIRLEPKLAHLGIEFMPYDRGKGQPLKGNVSGYIFSIEDELVLAKENQEFSLLIAHFDGEILKGNDTGFIALLLPYDGEI